MTLRPSSNRFNALRLGRTFCGAALTFAALASLDRPLSAQARFPLAPAPGLTVAAAQLEPGSSSISPADGEVSSSVRSETDLPEAPAPQRPSRNTSAESSGTQAQPVAPPYAEYIPAGWRAQPLTLRGKFLIGIRDTYSVEDFSAVLFSAGYEHLLDSEPNYGVDRTAFAKRVGAAAVRESSQSIFTDMVFAPLLHEDPRFYEEGRQYSIRHRTLYAITRPFVSRKDNGATTVNGALLLGYAASAALTPAFYPASNRNFHDTASTFGASIGGSAIGYLFNEFGDDVLAAAHLTPVGKILRW